MPRNLRPGYFTPGYENYNLGQLQDAQNIYDLTKAQEEANRLAQEKLKREKQKELEEIKKQKELERQAKEEEKAFKKAKKQAANMIEAELEIMQICKATGLDYDLLTPFRKKIVSVVKSQSRTLNRLQRQLDTAKEQLKYDKKELESDNCKVTSMDKFIKLLGGNPYHIDQREFHEKCVKQFSEDVKNYKALIRKAERKLEAKLEEFFQPINEFRATHYNEDVEEVFELMSVTLPEVDVKGTGTVEDYNKLLSTLI